MVFPDGHVDTNWGKPHRVKVLSDGVTAEETSILHQNVLSGTATRSAISCPTAAKTGTTSNLVDAWLDGYTPNYSTAVWMGYPNKRVPMTDVHGEPQQGGYLPAEIWHAYMAAVTEGEPCAEFPAPTEQISYQPFFGKFASTGLGLRRRRPRKRSKAAKNRRRAHPAKSLPPRTAGGRRQQRTPGPSTPQPRRCANRPNPRTRPTPKAPRPTGRWDRRRRTCPKH